MWPKACRYGVALASASSGLPVAQAALRRARRAAAAPRRARSRASASAGDARARARSSRRCVAASSCRPRAAVHHAPCGPAGRAPGCRACPRGSCSGGCRASTARPGSRACSRSRRGPGSPGCWPPGTTRWASSWRSASAPRAAARASSAASGVAGVLLVDQARAVQLERQRAFAVALLRQQHALDVGVLDDRAPAAARRPCRRRRSAGPAAGSSRSRATPRSRRSRASSRPGRRRCAPRSSCGTCSAGPRRAGRPGSRSRAGARRRTGNLPSPKFSSVFGDAAVAELVVEAGERHVVALAGELALRCRPASSAR